MVGMPVYGGYHPLFVSCLLDLVTRPPCDLTVSPLIGDSLVSRARNKVATKFMRSDCTHLLFIDTDVLFIPEHISKLLSHNLPFVVGVYPKKTDKLEWVGESRKHLGEADPKTGLQRILYGGTGFMLIAREVLEAIRRDNPHLEYQSGENEDPHDFDYFSVRVFEDPDLKKRRLLAEDWSFCQAALDSGYPLFADTHVILRHCGNAVYPLESARAQPPSSASFDYARDTP